MSDDTLLQRLHDGAARLAATRPGVVAGAPWPLAERFDDAPEAEWGAPEVLAHVAEMIPYWQGEMERILAADGAAAPVPFGRLATDTNRLGILERDRSLPPAELYDRIDHALERFGRRLSALTDDERQRLGIHTKRGEMTVAALADRFVVGHLADHAVQLEGILGIGPMES
jgi:DinB superfamily